MFSIRSFVTSIVVIALLSTCLLAQRRSQHLAQAATVADTGPQVGHSPGMRVDGAQPRTETAPLVTYPAQAAPSQPSVGLVINATYDSTITSQPNAAQIEAAIQNAIGIYQSTFSDQITVNIYFRYASTDPCTGSPLPANNGARSDWVYYTIAWDTFRTALLADAKSAHDTSADATVPAGQPQSVLPTSANGRALSMNTSGVMGSDCSLGAGGTYDGIVTLNSALAVSFTRPTPGGSFDAQRSVEHEIDEVLGIGSYLDITPATSNWRPEDLFTYSAPSVRNVTGTGTRYFSYNGGNTNVITLNQDPANDRGDWLSGGCPQGTPFVQNAVVCPGQSSDISSSSPEGIVLDVIGYDLVATAANVSVSGRVLTSSGSGIRNARVTMTDQSGDMFSAVTNAFGYYSLSDVPSGRDYMMSASARGFSFQPRAVSLTDSQSDEDFVASP
ncbi:MAG: carboxypeptidase regulatory-like domain-containing protein [Acidobacteria bacterium]|nr:carboxypeptidase regulatory-like domain-containing protein [Acidobacteriota bacterium]